MIAKIDYLKKGTKVVLKAKYNIHNALLENWNIDPNATYEVMRHFFHGGESYIACVGGHTFPAEYFQVIEITKTTK